MGNSSFPNGEQTTKLGKSLALVPRETWTNSVILGTMTLQAAYDFLSFLIATTASYFHSFPPYPTIAAFQTSFKKEVGPQNV